MATVRQWVSVPGSALFLVLGLSQLAACGSEASGTPPEKSSKRVCGLIDADLVTKLKGDTDYSAVGTLETGSETKPGGPGCQVLDGDKTWLTVTMRDFKDQADADTARQTITRDRQAVAKTCPEPKLVDDIGFGSACVEEQQVDYSVLTSERLIRLVLHRTATKEATYDNAAAIAKSIQRNANA
jgi:hypothetical protein